jgi:hypothetical protein
VKAVIEDACKGCAAGEQEARQPGPNSDGAVVILATSLLMRLSPLRAPRMGCRDQRQGRDGLGRAADAMGSSLMNLLQDIPFMINS